MMNTQLLTFKSKVTDMWKTPLLLCDNEYILLFDRGRQWYHLFYISDVYGPLTSVHFYTVDIPKMFVQGLRSLYIPLLCRPSIHNNVDISTSLSKMYWNWYGSVSLFYVGVTTVNSLRITCVHWSYYHGIQYFQVW